MPFGGDLERFNAEELAAVGFDDAEAAEFIRTYQKMLALRDMERILSNIEATSKLNEAQLARLRYRISSLRAELGGDEKLKRVWQEIQAAQLRHATPTTRIVGGTVIKRVDMPGGIFFGRVLPSTWEQHEFQAAIQVKQLKRFVGVARVARASGWAAVATELFNFVRKFEVLGQNVTKVSRDLALRRQVLRNVKTSLNQALRSEHFGPQGLKSNATVDTSSFDKALREYMKYTRKDLAKVVNQKSYWIARNAVYMTKRMTAAAIRNELDSPSRINPQLTVAEALIVNSERKKGNRLTDAELNAAVKRLRAARARSAGYLRSGWLQSVKAMSPHAEKKTPTFIENQARAELGGALAAVPNNQMKYRSSIWTNVKSPNNKTNAVLQEGIRLAMAREAQSMMTYVNRKLQQGADKFNRGVF